MKHIIKAEQLPNKEQIYLRKGIFSYRVVHPIKDENGKYIWMNLIFGGWANFIQLILLMALVLGFFWVYDHDIAAYQEVYENPCEFCNCNLYQDRFIDYEQGVFQFNLTEKIKNAKG
jgi:hypothetical protein